MIRITRQLDELDIVAQNLLMELQAQTISVEMIQMVYVEMQKQLQELRAIDAKLGAVASVQT